MITYFLFFILTMFRRLLTKKIKNTAQIFYAIAIIGPRQSGKTTLLKYLFPEYEYLNLEDPQTSEKVRFDPSGYFSNPKRRWIIDEAQEYPELFSYLLNILDTNKMPGQFILSGSKNFLLLEKISQTLAGRIAILELLPLTYAELCSEKEYKNIPIWNLLYQGSYPGPYHQKIPTDLWYKNYITTYLQRDVRQLLQIKNLNKFYLFLKLCANRHGQLINLSEISTNCGISHTTVNEWISVLEASYIVFRLPPYYKNFNKRLIKNSKLYFYDSGLVCHLLGINSGHDLETHSARGAIFEGYIVSEIVKQHMADGKTPQIYFWNSHKGFEIDLLVEHLGTLQLIEIKSSHTFATHFLKSLQKWETTIEPDVPYNSYIIYAGNDSFSAKNVTIISHQQLEKLYNNETRT